MRFLIDNQLPRALAHFLTAKGHQSAHVLDLGLGHLTPDTIIWEYAASHACIMVTKDADFIDLALLDIRPVQVVLVCLGNCRNATLLAAFEKVLPSLSQQLESGETLIEVWE